MIYSKSFLCLMKKYLKSDTVKLYRLAFDLEKLMQAKIHRHPLIILETNLDFYGHVNNATYMTLFEQARWDLITGKGYGLKKIMDTGIGPVILGVKMSFLKELRLRDEIVIETQMVSYEKKIGKMSQKMVRLEEVCCTAEFDFGLFSLKERKLLLPTKEWEHAIGLDEA